MQNKLSRILLKIELWLLVLPVTLLFLLGSYALIKTAFIYPEVESILISILALVCGLSIYSLLWISYKTLYSQNKETNTTTVLWTLIVLGGVVAVTSLISNNIPIVENYTPMYYFRSDLNHFVIGLPLVIVATHLYYES